MFSCRLSTYELVGVSTSDFGEVKVELRIVESCSCVFNFSSTYNLNNDDSSF